MIYDPILMDLFLQQENIKAVLTIWNEPKPHIPAIEELDHHYIQIHDSIDANIAQHFPSTFSFLLQKINLEGKRVFVHCHAGISRSATVVIHYLTKVSGQDLREIAKFVSKQRPDINPNTSFIRQLIDEFKS
ncbi:PTP-2 [Rachiplusia nu nucleopolyhedrovirus]|uniref:PTP-2 n=1 Tax=Rachiplusia nu nucleopolyhedrovirus TaxID=2605775 RepID=A0AAF1DB64_9ABAC|nr:PTP-2 [Rachiplusia nu nucleopolyhedrovirus]QEI03702.1 PTP-2 [Rachiplusia nu nucleopolyhedrovirus]